MKKKINRLNRGTLNSLIVSFTIILLLLLFFALSCETPDIVTGEEVKTVEGETEESQNKEPVATEKQEAEITLWDYLEPKGRLTLMEVIDSFMSENDHIRINVKHFRSQEELEDQFEAASLAGAGPEIILLNFDGTQRYVPANVAKEITSNTISAVDYSLFLDGLVEISEYNDRRYIIPFRSFDFLVFLYNKEFIEEPPENFEEIIEYCKKVNDPGQNIYGFLLNNNDADWVIPFIGAYGDWIVDYSSDSLTLANQATVKTMEFLDYIYNQEKILPSNLEYSEINELFKSGNVHMIIDNVNTVKEYIAAGIDVGVGKIPCPLQSNKNPTPLISGNGFIININCYGKELEAVNEFIKYMLTEEVQVEWTLSTDTFPVLKNIDENSKISNDALILNSFQQAKLCRGKPYDKLIRVIRDAIRDNMKNVISGRMLPEDAALKIQEDALRLRSGDIVEENEIDGAEDVGGTEETVEEGGTEEPVKEETE
ncbi:MAG: extracellular solute-binding protein [Actinomycetota bacterium]|nr:extracellular solute-binding protein [Actinomycetota bacterium]